MSKALGDRKCLVAGVQPLPPYYTRGFCFCASELKLFQLGIVGRRCLSPVTMTGIRFAKGLWLHEGPEPRLTLTF